MDTSSDQNKPLQRQQHQQWHYIVRLVCKIIVIALITELRQAFYEGVLELFVDAALKTLFNLLIRIAMKCDVQNLLRLLKVMILRSSLNPWAIHSRHRANPSESSRPESLWPSLRGAGACQEARAIADPATAFPPKSESIAP